jgi:hypothetical protein
LETKEKEIPEFTESRLPQTRMAVLETPTLFSEAQLERALNQLADEEWNSVVLPVMVEGYPIFKSPAWAEKGLRPIHPRIKGWDPLDMVFDVAWRRGLEILVYQSPYVVEGGAGHKHGPLLEKWPEWAARRHPRKQRRPSQYDPEERYYCPVNQDYRRLLCDMTHALLEEYPFHGLVLDLRSHPFYSVDDEIAVPWCYCEACRSATLRDLGFDPVDIDFQNEKGMTQRWREWQVQQIDKGLAHIRARSLKARSTMRVLGCLTSDAGLRASNHRPLIHWKSWVDRSLIEALVLDGYSADTREFAEQLQKDVEALPENFLLMPMLPERDRYEDKFLGFFDTLPIPGFLMRFSDWTRDDFRPGDRLAFKEAAFSVESDPVRSVCVLFDKMAEIMPHEEEFKSFLDDLTRILLRDDVRMNLNRLMMVADNIKGLHNQAQEGRLYFAEHHDQILHDLDLAYRLVFLAVCDIKE